MGNEKTYIILSKGKTVKQSCAEFILKNWVIFFVKKVGIGRMCRNTGNFGSKNERGAN